MNSPVVIDFNFETAIDLPREEVRLAIQKIEEACLSAPQVEIPVTNHFANSGTDKGIYGREITIGAGTLLVGKIHKMETINVISSGEVSVLSQDGVVRKKAPFTFVSSPGAKRVIYAHQDATWTCFHATGETDVEKIEEEFIAKNYDEVLPLSQETREITGEVCLG